MVPLLGILEQAVEAARPAIDEGQHKLTLDWPEADVRVTADPARMIQVISNLLTNAAKYTPDNGHIRLAARSAGTQALIEVADDGIGIAAEDQGRLFQLFTQLKHAAHRSKGGLGIGLSLVRKLAELHGGDVTVASAGLGAGSTFTVKIPLAEEHAAARPATDDDRAQGFVRKVMVVEDNTDGRESLVQLLQMSGHEVVGVGDGSDALSSATSFAPEVILLDLGLPGISGYEVCMQLRALPATAAATIVALTGWGSSVDRQRTEDAGFDLHLTKPADLSALNAILQAPQRRA